MKLNIDQLKEKLKDEVPESYIWLENQYPAAPGHRYSEHTYLNYQNLEDCFGSTVRANVERMLADHPKMSTVVLALLSQTGRPSKKPYVMIDEEARYYGQYELFAQANHIAGFVEVFQNIASTRKHPLTKV